MNHSDSYEVLIIGGGPAGLAAAMSLGRLYRRVLICDDRQPRNLASEHINNLPGHDGVHPETWRQQVRSELQKYATLEQVTERVQSIRQIRSGFEAHLASGRVIQTRKLMLAYGVKDQLPAIPQIHELWGKSLFHCPFCHGFELKDQALGLIGNGDMAWHLLPVLKSLSQDLILFTHGPAQLSPEQLQTLKQQNIRLIETPIQGFTQSEGILEALQMTNGETIQRQALYASPLLPFVQSSQLGKELGCEVDAMGLFVVDEMGKTSVEGIYAVGDIAAGKGQSVLNSAASGSFGAARIVFDLLNFEAL